MGRLVACFPKEENLDTYGPPTASRAISMLNLPQPKLAQVLLDEAVKLPTVTVRFNTELVAIDDDGAAEPHVVRVTARDTTTGAEAAYTGRFLVGADGAKSATRRLLKVPFQGHTWPDKLVATDVWLRCHDEMPLTTTQVMDPVHYAVITPLAPVVPGAVTKWRVSFALDPEDLARGRPLADFLTEDYISQMYERVLGGPRPIEYTIDRVSPYTMHQRLASTLKRGRCLLAGDTAHINTVCLFFFFFPSFPPPPLLNSGHLLPAKKKKKGTDHIVLSNRLLAVSALAIASWAPWHSARCSS